MSNAHGPAYAHMNNGQFETLAIGRRRSYQIWYIINCWNNKTNSITRYLQGWNHGCGPSYCVKISFVQRSVQQVKMMVLSIVLCRFTVNKDDTEASIGRKHELTNDLMGFGEKGKELWDTANLNRMIFYVRSMSTWWSSSGLIGFLQILKGLEAEGLRERFWEACGLRYEDMPKISQMAGILAPSSVRLPVTVWQPITRVRYRPAQSANWSRGWKATYTFEGLTLASQSTHYGCKSQRFRLYIQNQRDLRIDNYTIRERNSKTWWKSIKAEFRYLCTSKNTKGQRVDYKAQRTNPVSDIQTRNIKPDQSERQLHLSETEKMTGRMASGWMTFIQGG